MKKSLIIITTLMLVSVYARAENGDLYPETPYTSGKVRQEYGMVQSAYQHGNKSSTEVLAAISPGTLTCKYYFASHKRKDGVQLKITDGIFGGTERSVDILGVPVALVPKRDSGPVAQLDIDTAGRIDLRYRLEARLGLNNAAGNLLVSVHSGERGLDSWFSEAQYLVCRLP